MSKKPTLTYIENDKYKTITLNKINEIISLSKVFDIDIYKSLNLENCIIKDSFSVIQIENYTFKHNLDMYFQNQHRFPLKAQTLILKNCTFLGKRLEVNRINVELINPKFKTESTIKISKNSSTIIELNEEKIPINIIISNVSKCKLTASSSIKELYIDSVNNMHIKNLNINSCNFSYKHIFIHPTLILENSKIKNCKYRILDVEELNLINSEISSEKILVINAEEKLILTNSSKITSNEKLEINTKNLIFNDDDETILDTSSYLEASVSIKINNQILTNNNPALPVILTQQSFNDNLVLSRQNLIFILKQLQERIKETQESNLEKELKLQKKIMKSELEKEYQEKLNKLDKKLETKKLTRKKELETESIKKYVGGK